jgi:archaetidylinositol phosphate synthase
MPANDALSRRNDGLLSVPEQKLIGWLAPRLPDWLTPDRLTIVGFLGSLVAFGGYALVAAGGAGGLWIANLGLLINWFGDSLDGAIARRRHIERPRYGFFFDQSIDVISQLIFAIGLGVSGYIRFDVAALGLATYLMMSVQSLLRAEVTGVFHLASGRVGLTEVRVMFLAANAVFFLWPPAPLAITGQRVTYADLLGLVWIAANITLYVTSMIAELVRLARQEAASSTGQPPSWAG